MSRRPLRVGVDVTGSNFFHDYENSKALERIFNQEIFPLGIASFCRADLRPDLYITKRIWQEYIAWGTEGEPDRYESLLHKLFWDESQSKTVCVIGDVGIGKSTLINYYLRCYCPGMRPRDFRKKLLIQVDAKTLSTEGGIVRNLYYRIKGAIEAAHKDRGTPLAVKGGADIYDWVRGAFAAIDASRPGGHTFEYVVLFVDNLDQCEPDDQKKIVREIHSWNEQYPRLFYRVIFTFWPATIKALTAPDMVLLRSSTTITVGPLATDCHLERLGALNVILGSLATSGPAGRVTNYTSFAFENLQTNSIVQIARGLTNGDLRRELRILSDYLCSEDCYRHWSSGKYMSAYDTLRCLLLGRKDEFDHNVSRIANILRLGHAASRPRDLLVGWHLLEMLSRATNKRSLYKTLMTLGYAEENIEKVLDNAWRMNLYHRCPSSHYSDEDYVVHQDTVRAYLQLSSLPAYIDCLSTTTPVADEVAARMQQATVASLGDGFAARVACSLEFIRAVRRDEEEFLDIRRTRPGLNPEAFADTLAKHKIHLLWRKMAQQYWGRLNGLKLSQTLPSITDRQWNDWLESDVLVEFRTVGEYLTP